MFAWALVLVVTVKYVFITMRADNRGEDGSFALLTVERVLAIEAMIFARIWR